MSKPTVKIKMTKTDWSLEILAIITILATGLLIINSYDNLPNAIPIHFGLNGNADVFGDKTSILAISTIPVTLYVVLTIGLHFPHLFNYPYEITEENKERQYQNMILMIRVIKIIIALIFLYIIYSTIQTGLGTKNGLGQWFVPTVIILLLGTIVIFTTRGFKLR